MPNERYSSINISCTMNNTIVIRSECQPGSINRTCTCNQLEQVKKYEIAILTVSKILQTFRPKQLESVYTSNTRSSLNI